MRGGAHALLLLELPVELVDRVVHLHDRANGTKRVVLVNRGDAEDGHDRVADELLHGAAVALERPGGCLEVARHDVADCLGVALRAEPGGLRNV